MGDRPAGYEQANRYTTVIVDEALRRGIDVEILDPGTGEMRLTLDGTTRLVVQSLSDLCSAVAWWRCEDKAATRRVLADAGLALPPGREATGDDGDVAFLRAHGRVVVKPVRGEGGEGITTGVADEAALRRAVEAARRVHPRVLLEAQVEGGDVRVLVIDGALVAAAVRRPPTVTGDGTSTARELVDALNAERSSPRGTGLQVPTDELTWAVVAEQGLSPDDVPEEGQVVVLRGTANLHVGGTIEDVTDRLHPALAEVSLQAAAALGAPLLGVDLLVPDVEGPDHVVIEANAQAGLANHEPQPTAQRYLDLLFPPTAERSEQAEQVGRQG